MPKRRPSRPAPGAPRAAPAARHARQSRPAGVNGQPRISLCIIARDEAENLAALLEQVRSLVDEIVVVDTGSCDQRTLEVAQRYGARTARHEWTDDFSAARNATIDLATGDWILTLHADERLHEATPGALRTRVRRPRAEPGQKPEFTCFALLYREAAHEAQGRQQVAFAPRLFPRHPRLRWVGSFHEAPVFLDDPNNLVTIPVGELAVIHLGHPGDQARLQEKRARNRRMLDAAIALTPERPFVHFVAGRECLLQGDFAPAAERLERAVALAGEPPPGFMEQCYADLVTACCELGDYERAVRYGNEGLRYFPTADLDCAVALALLLRNGDGDADRAFLHFQRARGLYHIGNTKRGSQDVMTWRPLMGMGYVWERRGQWDRALACYEEALHYQPADVAIRRRAAAALRKLGRPAEAVPHLRQALASAGAGDPQRHHDADYQALHLALAGALQEAGELQDAYDYLDDLVRRWPAIEPYRLALADLLIAVQEYEAAVDVLGAALDGPDLAGAGVYQRLGAALTQLGRHADATNAYQLAASQTASQPTG